MLRSFARTYQAAFRGIPRPVWALAAVTLVNRAGTMVLPFLVLYFTTQKGLSAEGAGGLLAIYGCGAMVGAYLGGRLSDRLGALRVQELSLLATGLAFLLLGVLDSAFSIAVTLGVLAIVGEAFRPANAAALAELSPPETLVRAYALRRLAINLGMTLGPAVGGFLAVIGYEWLFRVDALTCFAAALLLRFTLSSDKRPQPAREQAASAGDRGRSPWRDPVFVAFLFLTFLLASVFFQIFSTFPLTLREHFGLAEDRIGLVFAFNTLLIILFEMVLTHRLESRNPLKVLAVGAFLSGFGLCLLPLGSSYVFLLGTVAIWTLGEMLAAPTAEGFVARRAAPAARGRSLGLYVMAWSTAFMVAPLTGTLIYTRFGHEALWYGCGGLGVVLLVGFLALSRHTARATAEST